MTQAAGLVGKPRWILIPVRVGLVTFLVTLLSFAVSLLLGIIGMVISSRLRGVPPDITIAYRHIAAPIAGVVGAIVLVLSLAMEIRHYRQAKVLSSIEGAG